MCYKFIIPLQRACGVPSEEILDTRGKIFSYFTKCEETMRLTKLPDIKAIHKKIILQDN